MEALIADLDSGVTRDLSILHREFPELEFSWDPIRYQRETVRALLYPSKGLHAYAQRRDGKALNLAVANIQYLPIDVEGLVVLDTVDVDLATPVRLAAKGRNKGLVFEPITLQLPPEFNAMPRNDTLPVSIRYRVVGTGMSSQAAVFPWPHANAAFAAADFIRQRPNIADMAFAIVDDEYKRITIRPGKWEVSSSVIIPAGYQVVAGSGTSLDLTDGAAILSYSPLSFVGDEEQPIRIWSSDSTGQGLVVMNADQESRLQYVHFEGLSSPAKVGWTLTGAVTFYESAVRFDHCLFSTNRSEDALNIVRADFTIENTLFADVPFDAFDADFATGVIHNSRFFRSGNDAIDASGSAIELSDIMIRAAGDKGISSGEGSELTGRQIDIDGAFIAIASKDRSSIRLRQVAIRDSDVALAAYQKKSEFGGGTLDLGGVHITASRMSYMFEQGSKATVNGTIMEGTLTGVADTLYPPDDAAANR